MSIFDTLLQYTDWFWTFKITSLTSGLLKCFNRSYPKGFSDGLWSLSIKTLSPFIRFCFRRNSLRLKLLYSYFVSVRMILSFSFIYLLLLRETLFAFNKILLFMFSSLLTICDILGRSRFSSRIADLLRLFMNDSWAWFTIALQVYFIWFLINFPDFKDSFCSWIGFLI